MKAATAWVDYTPIPDGKDVARVILTDGSGMDGAELYYHPGIRVTTRAEAFAYLERKALEIKCIIVRRMAKTTSMHSRPEDRGWHKIGQEASR